MSDRDIVVMGGSAGGIQASGGICIVQDPEQAQYAEMPTNALSDDAAHFVLPIEHIGSKLIELTSVDSRERDSAARTKVLIVEDERIVAKHLQDGLSDMGYDAECVASGESAITRASATRPDLVLMDIRLKGSLTGIEAARRIWDQLQIPMVYLTAHADLQTLQQAQTTQHYGYLVKPIHAEAARAAIESALGRRMKENR